MRVILIGPPWGEIYGDFKQAAKAAVSYPPLGLCYLSAYLKQAGHTVRVVDAEAEGLALPELLDVVRGFAPDLMGIQVVSPLWDVVETICRATQLEFNIPIVLGGPHITITKAEAFEQNEHFDYGIVGEGELPMQALANALATQTPISSIPGLAFRKPTGEIQVNPSATAPKDLDSYLMPDRSDLRMEQYQFSVPRKGLRPFVTLTSTRGCPFECTFCTEPMMFGRVTRFRSPKNVVDEMEFCHREYGTQHFIFVDDTLTVEKKRVYEMCRLILERGLNVTLEGWTHANTVNQDLLQTMANAGLVRLSFGVESGNADILRSLKKGTDHKRIRAAYRAAKGAGIETRGSVILGLPGDTKETVQETIDFVTGLSDLDHCYFNIAMPYPGTAIREAALKGEQGVRLLTTEYASLRRSGQSVVMEVNDLGAKDLLALQRHAYRSFWLKPARVKYNLTRAGWRAGVRNSWAFFASFILPHRKRSPSRFASEITSLSEQTGPPSRSKSLLAPPPSLTRDKVS